MTARAFLVHSTDWLKQTTTFVKFKLFQDQRFQNHSAKNLEMWFLVVSFMFLASQKSFVIFTRVTEELHSFLSQSELSNFFVYFISNRIECNAMQRNHVTQVRQRQDS